MKDKKKKQKITSKLYISIIALIVIVLLFIFIQLNKKVKVDYFILKPVDLNYSILASCKVDYPDPLDISLSDEGLVTEIYCNDGKSVEKGEKLMQLDNFEARSNYNISLNNYNSDILKLKNAKEEGLPKLKEQLNFDKANLDQAQVDYERKRISYNSGAIAKAELDSAENNYKKALAQFNQTKISCDTYESSGEIAALSNEVLISKSKYELAKKKLDEKTVFSPFKAMILKVNVQKGQKVSPSTSLITILEDKRWILSLNIDQKDIPFITMGLKGLVSFDAYNDRKINAEIVYLCSEIDKEKGTCELRMQLVDKFDFVKHGMTGSAEIFVAKYDNVLAVPSRFVKNIDGKNIVYSWDGKKANLENVQFQTVGERWKILKNINPGTIIIDIPTKVKIEKIELGNEIKKI